MSSARDLYVPALEESPSAQRDHAVQKRIWASYLYGQLSNVAKAAVWWSTFGTLVTSLMDYDGAVAVTRAAFNSALVLFSPLAGAVADRMSIRKLLNLTTLGRLLVWSLLVPATWILINNSLQQPRLFCWLFAGLMFVDGIQVAFANAVDIDCGGLDSLSIQYGLPIDEYLRGRFNSVHQTVFDFSFIIFTPPISGLVYFLAKKLAQAEEGESRSLVERFLGDTQTGVAVLLLSVSFVFFLLSVISLIAYTVGLPPVQLNVFGGVRTANSLPSLPGENAEGTNGSVSPSDFRMDESSLGSDEEGEGPSLWADTVERLHSLKDGFRITLEERALGWRILFLALETALEDAMVSVVIPQVALHTAALFASESQRALANLWAVTIIAVGKAGGLLAGGYMNARWLPPTTAQRYRKYRSLFCCVLLSACSILLFPLSRFILGFAEASNGEAASKFEKAAFWTAGFLVFLGSFCFFVFSTAPKIGFATLLQGLVSNQQAAGKVFGFVGTFVTITDGLVLAAVDLVLAYSGPQHFLRGLCIVSAIYLSHGLLEAFAGPPLILESVAAPHSSSVSPQSSSRSAGRETSLKFGQDYASTGGVSSASLISPRPDDADSVPVPRSSNN